MRQARWLTTTCFLREGLDRPRLRLSVRAREAGDRPDSPKHGGNLWDHSGPSTGSAPAARSAIPTAPKRRSVIGASAALAAMSALAVALIGAAPASADLNGCQPSQTIPNRLPSDLVGASFTTSVNTATYTFNSLVDRNPVNGVPGLIEYCIYPGSQPPDSVTVSATGDNGSASGGSTHIRELFHSLVPTATRATLGCRRRKTTTMGTATWSGGVPQNQIIVLHINDPEECDEFSGGDPGYSWVLPSGAAETPDVTTAPHFQDRWPLLPIRIDGAYPNFRATVWARSFTTRPPSTYSNGTPTGGVEFRKFDNGDCSGTTADTETVSLSGGSAEDQRPSSDYHAADDAVQFRAFYTPENNVEVDQRDERLREADRGVSRSRSRGRSNRNGDIYLMNGSAQSRLTATPAVDGEPAFFPRGRQDRREQSRRQLGDLLDERQRHRPDPADHWPRVWTRTVLVARRDENRLREQADRQRRHLRDERGRHRPDAADHERDRRPSPPGPPTERGGCAKQQTGKGDIYVMNADGTGQGSLGCPRSRKPHCHAESSASRDGDLRRADCQGLRTITGDSGREGGFLPIVAAIHPDSLHQARSCLTQGGGTERMTQSSRAAMPVARPLLHRARTGDPARSRGVGGGHELRCPRRWRKRDPAPRWSSTPAAGPRFPSRWRLSWRRESALTRSTDVAGSASS